MTPDEQIRSYLEWQRRKGEGSAAGIVLGFVVFVAILLMSGALRP